MDRELINRLKIIKGKDTQAAFARRCGVSPSLVQRWFSGEKTPSRESLERIAANTKTPGDWLLFGDAPRNTEGLRVAFYTRVYDILVEHLHRVHADLASIEDRKRALEQDRDDTQSALNLLTSAEGLGSREEVQQLASQISNEHTRLKKYAKILKEEEGTQ